MNYRDAQPLYLSAGWPGVLPLPARAKFPPPEGFTGRGAPYPDEAQLTAWRNGGGDGNLCLRLPEGVLGIDVDAYDGKPGAETLARLEAELGALPDTWRSSARPPPSGILFFRVPPGRQWRDPGPGLEVVHAGWRYAVAWPSIHPTGEQYIWYRRREPGTTSVPNPAELPWLPDRWVKHMDRGEAKPYVTSDVDVEWLDAVAPRNPEGWEKCPVMLDSASRHVDTIRQGAGRHDAMLRGVSAVIHLAVNGHRGGAEAVAELYETFQGVTTDRNTHGEFHRALRGALQKEGASLDIQSPPCRCGAPAPVATSTDTGPVPVEVTQAPTELFPILDWHELWAREDEEEDWIVWPLLPARRLIALYSAPKVGKSLLMLEVAAAIATGRDVLGAKVIRKRVLYVDMENDPAQDTRERLKAMGYKPENLDDLCMMSFPTIAHLDTHQGGMELLLAAQTWNCEVIVIDTVSRAVGGPENDNDTWLAFYRHTGLELKKAGLSLMRLDHTGKDEAKGQRGGSAKAGDVDAVWQLRTLEEGTLGLRCEAHRFPLGEQEVRLTLERKLDPLRHVVSSSAYRKVQEGQVQRGVKIADEVGLSNDAGRRAIQKAVRDRGESLGSDNADKVSEIRKLRLEIS